MSAVPSIAVPVLPTLAKSARLGHPETISDSPFLISDFAATNRVSVGPHPFRVGRDGVLVVPASQLEERAAPVTVTTGIAALDELTGGIPRGALTEICGPASSGRTSVLLSLMASMTQAGEVCALVDASDSFDPASAQAAGVELKRVLWVRCSEKKNLKFENLKISNFKSSMSRVEQALKATDLLLQGGGFGLIAVDMADIAAEAARRVPLTSWFRFRRAVENTATTLVVLEQAPYAKTCASLVIQLAAVSNQLSVNRPTKQPAHAALFGGLQIRAEVSRDRQQRKPVRSAETQWESNTQFVI
jgi:recombination protein RecA